MVHLHVGGGYMGNGFIVHSDGDTKLIMTCQHVVKTLAVNAVVPTYFSESCGGKTNARLLSADADRDLALLRVDGVHRQIKPILFTDEPTRLGNKVLLLTFFDMDGPIVVRPGR
jgi:S1-C subfamily serine protease